MADSDFPDAQYDRPLPGTGRDAFATVPVKTLGMWVFLLTLSVVFAASMAAYYVMIWKFSTRTEWVNAAGQVEQVPPMPDLPHLPHVLWASTVVILISSVTMQWALTAARRDEQAGLRRGLMITFALGLVFMVLQCVAWVDWVARAIDVMESHQAYRFAVTAFMVLSGLHAAHVIGGLAPLWVVLRRAFKGRYNAQHNTGVHHVTMYWHFLDVVWLLIFASLLVFT